MIVDNEGYVDRHCEDRWAHNPFNPSRPNSFYASLGTAFVEASSRNAAQQARADVWHEHETVSTSWLLPTGGDWSSEVSVFETSNAEPDTLPRIDQKWSIGKITLRAIEKTLTQGLCMTEYPPWADMPKPTTVLTDRLDIDNICFNNQDTDTLRNDTTMVVKPSDPNLFHRRIAASETLYGSRSFRAQENGMGHDNRSDRQNGHDPLWDSHNADDFGADVIVFKSLNEHDLRP